MKLNRIKLILEERAYPKHGYPNAWEKVMVWLMHMRVIGFNQVWMSYYKLQKFYK